MRTIVFLAFAFTAWHFSHGTAAIVTKTVNTANADSSSYIVLDTSSESARIKADSLYMQVYVSAPSPTTVDGYMITTDTIADSVYCEYAGSIVYRHAVIKGYTPLYFVFNPTNFYNIPNRLEFYATLKNTSSRDARVPTKQGYNLVYVQQ